jgi:4-hydroxy-tetrahydrodipicolinate synthase
VKLEGVYVALATPFQANGDLDSASLDKLIAYVIDAGVHGLVPCGTTGESPALSREEKRQVIALSVKAAAAKKLKVIAGCGTNCTRTTLEAMHEAADLGADGALIVSPYYNKPTPEGLLRHFTEAADKGRLPVVLYNVPGRTGVNLTPDLVQKLFQHPNIVAIKEASGQFGQWLAIAESCDLAAKSLLAGDDDSFAPVLALGGSGIISASANVAPAQFVAMYDAFRSGDAAGAWSIQKRLSPLVKALFAESNPGPVKHALSRLGLGEDALRLPLVPVREATRAALASAMKGLEILK